MSQRIWRSGEEAHILSERVESHMIETSTDKSYAMVNSTSHSMNGLLKGSAATRGQEFTYTRSWVSGRQLHDRNPFRPFGTVTPSFTSMSLFKLKVQSLVGRWCLTRCWPTRAMGTTLPSGSSRRNVMASTSARVGFLHVEVPFQAGIYSSMTL